MFYKSMSIQSTFTKNGNRLVTRMVKETVSKANPCIKHLENIPVEAKTFDLAVIQRKFGKEQVGIFSFRDAKGKLIQRIEEVEGERKQTTVSDYLYDSISRQVIRKTKENNNIIKEVFENITTLAKDTISRTSLTREVSKEPNIKASEKHFFGNFSKKSILGFVKPKTESKKFIASVQRHEDNTVKLNKVQYSGITKEDAKEIARDPYLFARLLPLNDFTAAVKPIAYANQGIERANIKTYKANLGTTIKAPIAQAQACPDGTLRILLNRQNLSLQAKPKTVESFNHEAKHCRQFIYMDQLAYTQSFPYYSMNPNTRMRQIVYGKLNDEPTIEYAKKLEDAANNYVSHEVDRAKYHNNFLEVEAREAGGNALKEYVDYANKLKSKIALSAKQLGLSD